MKTPIALISSRPFTPLNRRTTVVPANLDLAVQLGPLRLDNPVMPASGCFGPELRRIIATERLGAVVTKTVFTHPRSGNPAHRLAETTGAMLNSVGIPSLGVDAFIRDLLPQYRELGPPVVVSIGGLAVADYGEVAAALSAVRIAALEVNVSCPNLEAGGLTIGSDTHQVEQVIFDVVNAAPHPVIAKLTPNVTAIGEIARAAESAGACAVTVANTFVGLALDHRSGAPVLGNGTGGLSGPAIKPLALAKVRETAKAVAIPILGCGGVCTGADVLEYLAAGASAVQVGTATFTRPDAMIQILDELPLLMASAGRTNLETRPAAFVGA